MSQCPTLVHSNMAIYWCLLPLSFGDSPIPKNRAINQPQNYIPDRDGPNRAIFHAGPCSRFCRHCGRKREARSRRKHREYGPGVSCRVRDRKWDLLFQQVKTHLGVDNKVVRTYTVNTDPPPRRLVIHYRVQTDVVQ